MLICLLRKMPVKAVGLIKQGFHEVPHLMIGGAVFTSSIFVAMFVTRRHVKYNRDTRNWKRRYTVVREEDFNPKKQIQPVDRRDPLF